jgi:competence protein ComEC
LFLFLELIDAIQGELIALAPPSFIQVLLAFSGAALLLLPRGVPYRWMGAFLLVPLFIPPGARTEPGELELEILDVGQGTAVLLNSGSRTLLYDSGPGNGSEYDLVDSVIAPALAVRGSRTLGQVVISHSDLDHAGGMKSLLLKYGFASYRGNLANPHPRISPCVVTEEWSWPAVSFEVLHPTPRLRYLGNDSSCVISVKSGKNQILLSGDISSRIENRLLLEGVSHHTILLVPHHGSNSSSSAEFIGRIDADVAVATAGLGNRFGFPRPETRQRYDSHGTLFLSTGDCGAIRFKLKSDGNLDTSSARREKNRIWRWPAAGNCP